MVLKANLVKLVIGDLVLKAKLVLISTVLKVKFDCTSIIKMVNVENILETPYSYFRPSAFSAGLGQLPGFGCKASSLLGKLSRSAGNK